MPGRSTYSGNRNVDIENLLRSDAAHRVEVSEKFRVNLFARIEKDQYRRKILSAVAIPACAFVINLVISVSLILGGISSISAAMDSVGAENPVRIFAVQPSAARFKGSNGARYFPISSIHNCFMLLEECHSYICNMKDCRCSSSSSSCND